MVKTENGKMKQTEVGLIPDDWEVKKKQGGEL